MRLRLTLLVIVLLLAGTAYLGQGPRRDTGASLPPPPEIPKDAIRGKALSIDVELVGMDVVVVDKNGTLIGGLEKRDFKVFDEGVEQTISSFSANDAPLTVVIMFEFSKTLVYYLDDVFTPIVGFVNSLQENDWAALVKVDLHTEIMTDFTRNTTMAKSWAALAIVAGLSVATLARRNFTLGVAARLAGSTSRPPSPPARAELGDAPERGRGAQAGRRLAPGRV
jgi:hypothetical protein